MTAYQEFFAHYCLTIVGFHSLFWQKAPLNPTGHEHREEVGPAHFPPLRQKVSLHTETLNTHKHVS